LQIGGADLQNLPNGDWLLNIARLNAGILVKTFGEM
jgi:hypothetical protein